MEDRSLGLSNATNARDLGGYPTVDGRRVRRGVLFRANAFNRLTDEDVAAVARLGLRCLIDFRHRVEIELIGADRLPTPGPERLVSLPLFDFEHDVFTTVSEVLRGRAGPDSVAHLGDGGGEQAMCDIYRWFVHAPVARDSFGAALRLIAGGDALPLLFHCTAGKDRTGWLAALVLGALGVDRDTILADYLATNPLMEVGLAYMLSSVADTLEDPTLLLPLLEAREEYLATAFAEVDAGFGGLAGYLRDGLGLDGTVLSGLRMHLLE